MAFSPTSSLTRTSASGLGRLAMCKSRVISIKTGSDTLPLLSAMVRNPSTGIYQPWVAPTNHVATITKAGTVSGGTYTVTVDGSTTTAIAYNAANATILTALEKLATIRPGDVVLTGGGANGPGTGALTLTFGGNLAGRSISVVTSSASLTGGGTYDDAVTTAGVEQADELMDISGFLAEEVVQDASYETQATMYCAGEINVNDIDLNGETLANLKIALKRPNVKRNGWLVECVTGF
jgi:hypothetical protein